MLQPYRESATTLSDSYCIDDEEIARNSGFFFHCFFGSRVIHMFIVNFPEPEPTIVGHYMLIPSKRILTYT